MKILLLLAAFIALTDSCSKNKTQEAPTNTPETTTQWQLVWHDEFDRDDIFATQIWSKIPRRSNADWCNTMSNDDSLFEIADGNLILSGKMNTDQQKDTSLYITGGVFTKEKMYFEMGKIEVRCKLEGTKGSWPAIWMLPKTAKWPTGGEIDILERLNHDHFVYQTVHSTYTRKHRNLTHSTTHPINPNDYNVYGVEWDAEAVRFYVNNELSYVYKREANKETEGQYPFTNEPYYLLIDMQLGGKWVGEVAPFHTPVKMYIDWVRYYQK